MPNNPRQQIKKDLGRAMAHTDTIKEILMGTGEKYATDHPEITEQYKTVFSFFEQGKILLEGLLTTY